MDILFLIGRILFGGFFLMNGITHFTKDTMLIGYAKTKGVPVPHLSVYLSGFLILMGGLGIIQGIYVQESVSFIVLFLVLVTLKMHSFWKETDQMTRMGEMINFIKNIALIGAALMMLAIPEPWPLSIF